MARSAASKQKRLQKQKTKKAQRAKRLGEADSSPKTQPQTEPRQSPYPLFELHRLLRAGESLRDEIESERQQRLEALKAELGRMLREGKTEAALDKVVSMVAELERENELLGYRAEQAERFRFGRSTQKLSKEHLAQLYLAFGGDEGTKSSTDPEALAVPCPEAPEQAEETSDEADGEQEAGAETAAKGDSEETRTEPEKKRNRVQKMKVAPTVERNTTPRSVPEAERTCALCGGEKQVYGHVDHELIRFVPAKIVVDVERCEKMSCPRCRKDVSVAPRSEQPTVRRKVDASLLAKLVADKVALGLPLDRQRRELERLGLVIPDKTMSSYWAYTLDLLEPIACAVMSEVFGSPIVGMDDSHLKTLDKSTKNGTYRGHLWCFVGTEGQPGSPERIAFGYTPTWRAIEVIEWVGSIEGLIQCDGWGGYDYELEADDTDGDQRVLVPRECRLGCGMHIRAKFHAALSAKDGRAAIPLKLMAALYRLEAEFKERGLSAEERGEERRRRSLPIVSELYEWIDTIHPKLLPKSRLRRATTYARNQRDFFERCFQDGRGEIDNGRVERRIRNFAIGRRGFHFTGSARGGERLAIAYTLVDNCLNLGIDPHAYLVDVITKLENGWPLRLLSELIPWRWAAEQARQNDAE